MAFWCKFFMRLLMLDFVMLRSAKFSMDCLCIAPFTPIVIVIRGFVFHCLFLIALISGSYLACFCVIACLGNLLWQYVNLMNCIVYVCEGNKGVGVWFGTPSIHMMSGRSLAWHWHLVCVHVHSMSHSGTVCSWLMLLRLPVFVSV
jgi:hypothetical protein